MLVPHDATKLTLAVLVLILAAFVFTITIKYLRQMRKWRAAELFRLAAENASDGLVVQQMDGTVLWANRAYLKMMGRSPNEVIGKNPLSFALPGEATPSPADIARFRYDTAPAAHDRLQMFRNQRGDGSQFWNQISIGYRPDETGEPHVVLVCRDVSENVAQESNLRAVRDSLAHQASHDGLTGLANRTELIRFVEEAMRHAREKGEFVGLLHIDLDRFKEINDTHGHAAGDRTLQHTADSLCGIIRKGDLVARVGGDEFVVVCPGMPDLQALDQLARSITAAVSRSFEWESIRLTCRASVGCALSDSTDSSPQSLLAKSDFALYEAKRAGRSRVAVYDEGLHQRHTRIQKRAVELREAVEIDALDHMYQPILNLETGRICGFETLVRWQHEVDGMINPADFLPMAEELGILAPLDLSSMKNALAFQSQLAVAGHGDICMSFNASADLLRHPSFINRLVFGAVAAGMDRSKIAIEVLETTVLSDQGDLGSPARIIRDLRDAGFQVYLDDFGMGYAGLAHLAELDITGIKLDKTLVKRMLTNETSGKIVATITELCRDLNLRMVAEGVEDFATAERLRQMGCKMVQGFWLSRPMAPDDALAYVLDSDGAILPPRKTARRFKG